MSILKDPTLYSDGNIGAGKVATLEPYVVNTFTAGADIKFGQAVVIKNGLLEPATKAPMFGVALARQWTDSTNFVQEEMEKDHWSSGKAVDIMRDGTISVQISDDVNAGENATVDADGLFKAAGTSDKVVGVFTSTGNKGGTANLQIRVQFDHGNADDDTGAGASSVTPHTQPDNTQPAGANTNLDPGEDPDASTDDSSAPANNSTTTTDNSGKSNK